MEKNPNHSITDYFKLTELGQGTYDKGCSIKTKTIYALKKIKRISDSDGFPITAIREIKILSELNHPNIIKLEEVVSGKKENSLYLVLEYCDIDLSKLFQKLKHYNEKLDFSFTKYLIYQLLQGISYIHENYIIHRDLKLSNLLIKKNGNLKITDFGLARHLNFPNNFLTPKLVTLWYRAPEILLNNNKYSWASDIWAIGCILCEILDEGQILFPGKNEINQFNLICKFIGKPNQKNWSDFFLFENCDKLIQMNKDFNDNFIGKKYAKFGKNCVELINGMLKWDPKERISAREALMNNFFQEMPIMSKNSFAKFQKFL